MTDTALIERRDKRAAERYGKGFGTHKSMVERFSDAGKREARVLRSILRFPLKNGSEWKRADDVKAGLQRLLLDEPTVSEPLFMELVREACRLKAMGGKPDEAARLLIVFNLKPADVFGDTVFETPSH